MAEGRSGREAEGKHFEPAPRYPTAPRPLSLPATSQEPAASLATLPRPAGRHRYDRYIFSTLPGRAADGRRRAKRHRPAPTHFDQGSCSQQEVAMLVVISDLHLTDGTSGATISSGAF